MKKIILICIVTILSALFLNSQSVDVDEIKKGGKNINFENYSGDYSYNDISTIKDVKNIGYYLAKNEKIDEKYTYYSKYSIINIVKEDTMHKLNADLIIIENDAKVKHIANIRLIISSYLEKKYGYNEKEAKVLAVFITYYNALFKGNLEYYSGIYKNDVLKHLSKDDAGLSTKYNEWPGKTKIIIPISNYPEKGKLNSLVINEISGNEVVNNMRNEKNKNLDVRQNILKIRKKAVEETKKEIFNQKKLANSIKNEIKKEKERLISIGDEEKEKIIEDKIKQKEEEFNKINEKINYQEKNIITEENNILKESELIDKDEKDNNRLAYKKYEEELIKKSKTLSNEGKIELYNQEKINLEMKEEFDELYPKNIIIFKFSKNNESLTMKEFIELTDNEFLKKRQEKINKIKFAGISTSIVFGCVSTGFLIPSIIFIANQTNNNRIDYYYTLSGSVTVALTAVSAFGSMIALIATFATIYKYKYSVTTVRQAVELYNEKLREKLGILPDISFKYESMNLTASIKF